MENGSAPVYFQLTMFMRMGQSRYLAFAFCLLLYGFIVFANVVVILAVLRENALHQPMYIFVGFLCLNALYGSAGFFPRFLQDLLSDSHLISRRGCFVQIYVIYTYASYELTVLSIMAYDRYVAVCHPLRYHSKMNYKTVGFLTFLAWVAPACNLAVTLNIIVRLPLCGDKIYKIYCASWNVVKLSCVPASVNNVFAMLGAIVIAFLPFGFILYTYLRIVMACWKSSAEVRGKVLQGCLPHVVSFAVYSVTSFSDTALSRQNVEEVNPFAAIVLSLEFIVIPPVLNPLVYGLKLPEIRRSIFRMLRLQSGRNPRRTRPEAKDVR